MKATRVPILLLALVLVAVGCSGDDESATTTQAPATTAAEQSTTLPPKTTVAVGNAVNSLADVRGAVVRIVAEGSFVDPEFGQQYNAAGSGSGFFIDEGGIAVTNNHVVTGAAFLQVYVEGEEEPRNARVLGVSECSDLAVIDVEGDGYPFLEWYDGDIAVGTEIYAAGFPLGNDEYTLLDGIVSKESADGESDWASVDAVIEHSADTLPGNSGGPIVTQDGEVVAVNYAGDSAGQAFGIGRDEVLEVLPALIDGEDVTSIGINGQAFFDGAFSGIWVASVASGSAADLGGIEAGDVVTLIEGLIPATDGTMADYCDILRSHRPGDPLAVEVYRATDDAFLEGTLNTENVLEVSYSFASELGDSVDDAAGTSAGYDSYITLVDVEGIMSIDVPEAWTDTDVESFWRFGEELVGVSITAAEDIAAWTSGWDTPGVFFAASTALTATESVRSLLDGQDYSFACQYDGRYDYSDALYDGAYDLWIDCDGRDTLFVVLAAETPASDVLMMLQIVVASDADLEALDAILASFVVDEVALAEFSSTTTTGDSFGVFDFADLFTGECFNLVGGEVADIQYGVDVEVVDCGGAHTGEVYANYFIPDADAIAWPGDESLSETAGEFCAAEFESYVGSSYADSSLDYWLYWPSQTGWDEGRRFLMCALFDYAGGDLVGSAWQSGW